MEHVQNAYVVIVEKEAVFQSLVELTCTQKGEESTIILITGRGYPDITTRRFIKHLVVRLKFSAYYIGDYDPYGIAIYLVHTFGADHFESREAGCIQIKWLGLHGKDVQALPPQVFESLTHKDVTLLQNFLNDARLQKLPQVLVEIQTMLDGGRKCEIEVTIRIRNIARKKCYKF